MRRVFQNSISRFLVSYLLMLIIPLAIAWIGFQIAFGIVEDNLIVVICCKEVQILLKMS